MNKLISKYQKEVVPKLIDEYGITNVHQVPRIEKIIINIGLGKNSGDKRALETATNTLRKISGQAPISTIAKHSIAGFKLRAGQKIGLKVTLRRERMYAFLERLITVVLPRMRDFHGLSRRSFDGSGNYSIGIADQSVFPELTYEETAYTHGLEITIVSSGGDNTQSQRMLELMGLPLERTKV